MINARHHVYDVLAVCMYRTFIWREEGTFRECLDECRQVHHIQALLLYCIFLCGMACILGCCLPKRCRVVGVGNIQGW